MHLKDLAGLMGSFAYNCACLGVGLDMNLSMIGKVCDMLGGFVWYECMLNVELEPSDEPSDEPRQPMAIMDDEPLRLGDWR